MVGPKSSMAPIVTSRINLEAHCRCTTDPAKQHFKLFSITLILHHAKQWHTIFQPGAGSIDHGDLFGPPHSDPGMGAIFGQ